MLLEANIGLILAKTACSAKFRFLRFGPEKTENGYFRRRISRDRKELSKILFDF